MKRFRYSGLTWQKITVGVTFPLELDLQPFYMSCNQEEVDIYQSCDHFVYDLSGVVVHHGLRFSRGHYTAYCWNSQAGEMERKRQRETETDRQTANRETERQRETERETDRQRQRKGERKKER